MPEAPKLIFPLFLACPKHQILTTIVDQEALADWAKPGDVARCRFEGCGEPLLSAAEVEGQIIIIKEARNNG